GSAGAIATRDMGMRRLFQALVALGVMFSAGTAMAQKPGGVLRVYHRDSPASMSIHEEGTVGVIMPMMGVFNNLVIFDQHVPQNSLQSVIPELPTGWARSADGTELTFKLRDDVKVARRQALYCRGCQMHLRSPDQPSKRKISPQLPRDLVG